MRFIHVVAPACLIIAAACGTEQADVPTELVAASEPEPTTSATETDESERPTTSATPTTEQPASDEAEVIAREWARDADRHYLLEPADTIDLTSIELRLITPRAIADLEIMSEPTATDELHPTAAMAINESNTPYLLVPCTTLDKQLTTSVSRTLTQQDDSSYFITQHTEAFESNEAALRHAELNELFFFRGSQLNDCEENDTYLIDAQVIEGDTNRFPTDDTRIRAFFSIPLAPADTDSGSVQRFFLDAAHDQLDGQYDFYGRWEGLIIVDGNTVTTTHLIELGNESLTPDERDRLFDHAADVATQGN